MNADYRAARSQKKKRQVQRAKMSSALFKSPDKKHKVSQQKLEL